MATLIETDNPMAVRRYGTDQFVKINKKIYPVYEDFSHIPDNIRKAYVYDGNKLWLWDWWEDIKEWFKGLTPYVALGLGLAGAGLIIMARKR